MPFSTETEQIKKFENDEVAQHYFEVLRTLISNKSIFDWPAGSSQLFGRDFYSCRCQGHD